MSKELDSALVEILNTTIETKDFILAEMPEVIAQLLNWQLTWSVIVFVGSILYLFFFLKSLKKLHEAATDIWNKYAEVSMLGIITGSVTALIAFFAAMESMYTIIQILVAPKLFLIEYAAKLVS